MCLFLFPLNGLSIRTLGVSTGQAKQQFSFFFLSSTSEFRIQHIQLQNSAHLISEFRRWQLQEICTRRQPRSWNWLVVVHYNLKSEYIFYQLYINFNSVQKNINFNGLNFVQSLFKPGFDSWTPHLPPGLNEGLEICGSSYLNSIGWLAPTSHPNNLNYVLLASEEVQLTTFLFFFLDSLDIMNSGSLGQVLACVLQLRHCISRPLIFRKPLS